MAIGTPATLGTNATNVSSGSIALTTTAAVSAGESIIVEISLGSSTRTVTSVTDTAGNTYALDVTVQSGSRRLYIASAHNVLALASGDTITATCDTSFSGVKGIAAAKVSGLATTGALDKTSTNSGASAAWTTGSSGTLSQASEIAFAALYNAGASANTPDGSSDGEISDFGLSTGRLVLQYDTVSSTTAVNSGGTAANNSWVAALATYREDSGDRTVSVTAAAATAAGGTVTATIPCTVTVVGAAATAAGGTVDPSAALIIPITAAAATAAGGTVTPVSPATVSVTGAAATASGGTVLPFDRSANNTLTWQIFGLWMPGESTIDYYGQVLNVQNEFVERALNGPRLGQFTVSVHEPIVEHLVGHTYERTVQCWHRGRLKLWGVAKVNQVDLTAGTVTVSVHDRSLSLMRHFLRRGDLDGLLSADNNDRYPVAISSTGLRFLRDAALNTEEQTDRGVPDLGIEDGTADGGSLLSIGVERGQGVWEKMVEASLSFGPDFELEPVHGTPGVYARLNVYERQGSDLRATAQFHYGTGLNNLTGLEFVEGEEYVTHVHSLSADLGQRVTRANENASADTGVYVMWDATGFDADHSSPENTREVLAQHASDLLQAYSRPSLAVQVTLPPDYHALIPDVDYSIGDTVSVAGRLGYVNLEEAPYRITRLTLRASGGPVTPEVEVVADRAEFRGDNLGLEEE